MEAVDVFFSYSHRDERLRDKLALHLAMLQRQGVIKSWHDRKISAGSEWAKEIDDQLNAADIILLLVSDHFLASDYCYDIEMKRAVERHDAGEAIVVPIILKPVDWSGAPFGKLQAFPKDAKPVTKWSNRDEAFLNIAQGIREAAQTLAAQQANRQAAVALVPTAVAPSMEWEELGGQVPLDSRFYVERPPIEARCYQTITRPGALIRIKAPRQMGKSSLTIRIQDQAAKQGYASAWMSLQRAGKEHLSDLDGFLRWLCANVTDRLKLPSKVDEYWQGIAGSADKATDYFELYLLSEIQTPLVLCLDEVDEVFKYPAIAGDVFGLLRSWHEESKINPIWQNLRLVITHSEEVYIPLNINQSPFNVGMPVNLPPLMPTQLADLVQRYGLAWSEGELADFADMVGGHPFLARVGLQHIAWGDLTLAQFLEVAPTQAWEFSRHLMRHLGNLEERNLVEAMKQVIVADQPVRLPIGEASKLENMGLVRFQGNDVVPLCGLYRQYFREVLRA
ncbi:AAA-like domain-containing protein [Sphaerothrix gracilis]|uniref:AAA-like domain-containing protein n=1 Tax=Sphaerothrix gracilis TaxID=3151835 RepID=UPI0031FC48CB